MNVTSTDARITEIEADAVVVGIDAQGTLTKEARELDEALGGLLSRLAGRQELSGKTGDVTTILAPSGMRAGLVAVAGMGNPGRIRPGRGVPGGGGRGPQAGRKTPPPRGVLPRRQAGPNSRSRAASAARWWAAAGRTCTARKRTRIRSKRSSGTTTTRSSCPRAASWAQR